MSKKTPRSKSSHRPAPVHAAAARPAAYRAGLGRACQIAWVFAAFGAWFGWLRLRGIEDNQRAAERFAAILQGLGTAFIKLGQHLSLRADLLPEEAQQVLARLQAQAAPFPGRQVIESLEAAFGASWRKSFQTFELEPMAAGSIAQIHRATLTNGAEVIVKIRRPGAAEQTAADMRILHTVVRVLEWLAPSLRRWALASVVEEITEQLRLEMDLAREARFVRRFAEAWRDSPEVDIPDVIDGLCTPLVLVQRFSHGRPLESLAPQARQAAAQRLVDSYIAQIFRHGLFHGDPHPGNVFVLSDGRLCLHDFGIVGRADPRMRRALAAFALAFVEQDTDWVVDAWLDLGLVGPAVDRSVFLPVVQSLIVDSAERPLREWSLAEAFRRLASAGRACDVRLPRDLLVLMRTLLVLEGTVRALAPEFSIFEAMSHHAGDKDLRPGGSAASSRRLGYEVSSAAADLPSLLARRLHGVLRQGKPFELSISANERLEAHIDRASRRISLGLVTLGLYIASSLLMQHGVGPRLGDWPVLALAGYALAVRYTFNVASRSS